MEPLVVRERFPRIYETCQEYGVDITAARIPVHPAAHYAMGGVSTDLDGRTTLAGLFAAGEVACTGVHGANRLASNSLLEGLVFGARAGKAMPSGRLVRPSGSQPERLFPSVKELDLRSLAFAHVRHPAGRVRSDDGSSGWTACRSTSWTARRGWISNLETCTVSLR